MKWPWDNPPEPPATYEETKEMLRRIAELQELVRSMGGRITEVDSKELLRQIRREKARAGQQANDANMEYE